MPRQILHLDDSFFFNEYFNTKILMSLLEEIIEEFFTPNLFELDFTCTSLNFYKNRSLDTLKTSIINPNIQVNSLTIHEMKKNSRIPFSVVLYLDDDHRGFDASFTIVSDSQEHNMKVGDFISEVISRKQKEIREKQFALRKQKRITAKKQLEKVFNIPALGKQIIISSSQKKDYHNYFFSGEFEVQIPPLSWDRIIKTIDFSLDTFFKKDKKNIEVLHFPIIRHLHIEDMDLLIHHLKTNGFRKHQFLIKEIAYKSMIQNTSAQFNFIPSEKNPKFYTLDFLVNTRSNEKSQEMGLFLLENIFFEIEQSKYYTHFDKTDFFDCPKDQPNQLSLNSRFSRQTPAKNLIDFIAAFITFAPVKKQNLYFELLTEDKMPYYFHYKQLAQLQAIMERQGLQTLKMVYKKRGKNVLHLGLNLFNKHIIVLIECLGLNLNERKQLTLNFQKEIDLILADFPLNSKTKRRKLRGAKNKAKKPSNQTDTIRNLYKNYELAQVPKLSHLLRFVEEINTLYLLDTKLLLSLGDQKDYEAVFDINELSKFKKEFKKRDLKYVTIGKISDKELYFNLEISFKKDGNIFITANSTEEKFKELTECISTYLIPNNKNAVNNALDESSDYPEVNLYEETNEVAIKDQPYLISQSFKTKNFNPTSFQKTIKETANYFNFKGIFFNQIYEDNNTSELLGQTKFTQQFKQQKEFPFAIVINYQLQRNQQFDFIVFHLTFDKNLKEGYGEVQLFLENEKDRKELLEMLIKNFQKK